MSKKLLAVLMLMLFVVVSPVAFAEDDDGERVGDVACKMKAHTRSNRVILRSSRNMLMNI